MQDHFSSNPVLTYEHPEGDWDTISWPQPNEKHLRGALYDAREQGIIADVREVVLPDDTMFSIE